jgi:transglutaminase-like putative cysteine protease
MYDIRQFKPALYLLIILGMSGFALAASVPGVWVLAVGAVLLNAWLVYTGRFRPMPRLVANVVTLLGLLALAAAVRAGSNAPILIIGQFLVLLQIVKLFEQRANRDFAQLLVLSLLLMVAGAISTYSLVFGLLFISYLFLSLYCCLLFHLKVETDHAKQAIGIPEEKLNPATLRQDERRLSSSMRRLTMFVSSFSLTTAVLTFVLFPRGPGAGLLGPLQWKPSNALTGFSDSVSFQNVAMITQNTQHVAYVKVLRDGKPHQLSGPLLLRGITLDHYSGDGRNPDNPDVIGHAYEWTRSIPEGVPDDMPAHKWHAWRDGAGTVQLHQQISLDPTGTRVLFAIGGISSFKPSESGRFQFTDQDQVLQTAEPIVQPLRYEVISRDEVIEALPGVRSRDGVGAKSVIDPKIEQFARRADVSGSDERGPLAERRDKLARVSLVDATIAANIESFLRNNFLYTLDLTDARRIEGQDPMVAFVYDLRRGHCEYFAGAMTLMCQSLGMQARMVVGFKCDNYNPIGQYYAVQQLHAHAWVEVLDTDHVWRTYDPTSGREAPSARQDTLVQRLRAFFSFLEYTWANTVVAYDRDSRSSVFSTVERGLGDTAARSRQSMKEARNWLSDNTYSIFSKAITAMIALMGCAIIGAVGWYLWERWKLRRRARRMGFDVLPTPEKLKLARQLGFYDDLLRLLERYRILRPAHLTPLEFSESLTFLPVDAFDAIRRLTDVFYRVRYGRAELTSSQRRRLTDVISSVESSLGRGQI